MKIAVFAPKFLQTYGLGTVHGSLVLLKSQLEALHELVCEIIILAESSQRNVTLNIDECKVFPLFSSYPKLAHVTLDYLFPDIPTDIIYSAARIISKERADIIMSTGSIFSALWTVMLGHLTGKRTVHQIPLGVIIRRRKWWPVDAIGDYRTAYRFIPQFVRDFTELVLREIPKNRLVIRGLLNSITHIVVNSNFCKKELIEIFDLSEDKIDIIYPIVKLPKLNDAHNEGKPIITYFGNLRAGRGVLDVIKAFKIIHRIYPQARLMIASSEIYEPTYFYCKKLVHDLGLENNVTWRGFLADIYSDLLIPSTVIVLPYKDTPSIKLIEAMAAAKPVITTRLDWAPEFISDGENGYLVNLGDTDTIASKALSIINDSQLAKRMGRKAREFIENKCSAKMNSKLLINTLENVLKTR